MTTTTALIESSQRASRTIAVYGVLALLVLAVYWPAFWFGYVDYDDPFYINLRVTSGLTLDNIRWAMLTSAVAYWHPMTWISLMADTTCLGNNPSGHHAVNIALHVANVWLLLTVLNVMTGAFWRSALAAALLAVHPMHVESVTWITERKDVLSLFFWLLTIWAYVLFTRRGGWRWYLLTMVFFGLGLMSKAMVLTLPCVLLLLDYWPLGRWTNSSGAMSRGRTAWLLIREKLPLLGLSAFSAAVTRHGEGAGVLFDGIIAPLHKRIENAFVSYVLYLEKLVWPAKLSSLYLNLDRMGRQMWQPWQWIAAAALLAIITILVLGWIRRWPFLAVGWLWFLGTLVPVIGLIQVGRQSMADRFVYIPYIGLYIAFVWMLGAMIERRPRILRSACMAGLSVIIVALAVVAHRQVWVWRDSRALFQQAIDATFGNWIMHVNMARILEAEGNLPGATEQYAQAVAIYPECTWTRDYYGILLGRQGRLYESEEQFRTLIEYDPRYISAYLNLGMALIRRNHIEEGLAQIRHALELDPSHAEARMKLAVVLSHHDQFPEAMRQMEQAIQLSPENAPQWQPMLDALRSGKPVPFP